MRAALFDTLDLRDVTLVGQDWGGLIGLRLVGEHPDRFARVVAANTFLPTGDTPPGDAFLAWQRFSQTVEDFPVGFIVSTGCTTDLADEHRRRVRRAVPRRDLQGRRAAVPDAGAHEPRRPRVGREPRGVGRAADVRPPVPDRVLGRGRDHARRRSRVPARRPGLRGPSRTRRSTGGGHFLQEDRGEELARVVADCSCRADRWPDAPTISSRCSTRSRRSRRPACTTARTRSIASGRERLVELASRGYGAIVRRSIPTRCARGSSPRSATSTAKVGADGAVFDDDDRVLLVRRADDDRWGLVAGWVDPNESPEQTRRARARGRARRRRAGRAVRRRVLPARRTRARAPHGRDLARLPLLDHGGTLHAAAARGAARSRGTTSTTSTSEWHHQPRASSRAARSTRGWRAREPGSERAAARQRLSQPPRAASRSISIAPSSAAHARELPVRAGDRRSARARRARGWAQRSRSVFLPSVGEHHVGTPPVGRALSALDEPRLTSPSIRRVDRRSARGAACPRGRSSAGPPRAPPGQDARAPRSRPATDRARPGARCRGSRAARWRLTSSVRQACISRLRQPVHRVDRSAPRSRHPGIVRPSGEVLASASICAIVAVRKRLRPSK